MKQKPLLVVLIIIVGAIWWKTIAKLLPFLPASEDQVETLSASPNFKTTKKSDYNLSTVERNPFGLIEREQIVLPISNQATVTKPKITPIEVVWPKVEYYGMIKKTTEKKPRGMIRVDGQYFQLREGQPIYEDLKIIKVDFDEITFFSKGYIKVIKRKK